jgi:prephenate dehydratase
VAVYDTAGAAKEVADMGDPTRGAIAAARAAARYGLEVLAENVEDRPDNQTRFLVVVPAGSMDSARPSDGLKGAMKSAVLVETRNEPGALLSVLSPFADRQINLTKLESRPAGEPWTYRFFLEFDADARTPEAESALGQVRERSVRLLLLGTFPRWEEDATPGK